MVAQDWDEQWALVKMLMNMKCGKFLDKMRNCYVLKKDST
jgi:hypothetical protein